MTTVSASGSQPQKSAATVGPDPAERLRDAETAVASAEGIRRIANAARALSMDAVEAANSGHPGLPLGMADAATALFARFMSFDPAAPDWPDRDRFVLSAGHGSMLLYSLLHLTGYAHPTIDEIKHFRQWDSPCAGHPEYGHLAGVETTTGPLGQGIANAVGMALAERVMNARFGDALVNHRTYVIASDGDLMEGISHECAALAGHLKLNRLIVLYDDNRISIDGPTSLADSTDVIERFAAYGWHASRVDGMDGAKVTEALAAAQTSDRPVLIACRTTIGYGAPTRAGTAKAHGEALGAAEVAGARKALGWPYPPFEVPEDIAEIWHTLGGRGTKARTAWDERFLAADMETRAAFTAALADDIPEAFAPALFALKEKLAADKPEVASRKASEMVLEIVNAHIPTTLGGSGDLTGSNYTRTKDMKEIAPNDYSGRFVHFGVREHAMVAALTGIALHGGIIPYSGTFLIFSDYCRPSIRLAALMGKRIILVMTHDSIGLGEDGPTHQPIEQLASLRAIPNLLVMRPADAVETAECWEVALNERTRPVVLALSRQGLATLREEVRENRSARGAYVLVEADGKPQVTLLATGSEVQIAMKARTLLKEKEVAARVVSMPCWELFEAQDTAYRAATIDTATRRVAVEAAVPLGWERYIGPDGAFIGMHRFGASAPYKKLYEEFHITAEAVVQAALAGLKKE